LLQEFNSKLGQLTSDIVRAEKEKKSGNATEKSEKDRIQKEKDKHEALRKELEAQRLK